jgi:ubiquinol-cytochrome c reductase iron-sulfur subunit
MSSVSDAHDAVDTSRRAALATASVVGGAGVLAAAAPFVASFTPSERAKAAGAPVEVDLSGIAPGAMKTVEWRGKPVWILHRTPEMIEAIKKTSDQVADPGSSRTAYPTPPYAQNVLRSIKPEYLIVVGICTHLGCSPVGPLGAGANATLGVPPHKFLSEAMVVVGEDKA